MSARHHFPQGGQSSCRRRPGGRSGSSCPRSWSRSSPAWARRSCRRRILRCAGAKAAPFPEPEEELYGVEAGGKMYVIGGFGANGRPAPAMVYEYDPAADRWTKKKPIPVAVHHQAQTEYNGKIYVFGGCMRPFSGPGMNGWEPVDNAWEYDPAADSWRALAPMPGKRCAAVAEEVGGKIYVIGGATIMENSGETALFGNRPARVVGTNQVYDPATNTWATRSPMPTTRNHAFAGAVNGKIYVIGGRLGAAHVTASSNTDVVEEYDPGARHVGRGEGAHADRAQRRRMGDATTAGSTCRGRAAERSVARHIPCARGLRAGDEPLDHPSLDAERPSWQRRRVHRQPVASGQRKAGRRRAARPRGKATAAHDVLEIPANIGTY